MQNICIKNILEPLGIEHTSVSADYRDNEWVRKQCEKVIETFPSAEKISGSASDKKYFHGSYFYDCDTYNSTNGPEDEKEKIRSDWEDKPTWLSYFPYVKGNEIHIVGVSRKHIWHYVFNLANYTQISKKIIETDAELQNYGVAFNYERISDSSPQYRWFYGTTENTDYSNVLSAFEWDGKYFVITKNPIINCAEITATNNYGQMRIINEDGKSAGTTFQYIADGSLANMTTASFWGFYVDEKTNTPLVICDSYNTPNSLIALEIVQKGEDYGWYRMRFSVPTYG